jgi:hypothetical protein
VLVTVVFDLALTLHGGEDAGDDDEDGSHEQARW